MKIIDKLFKKDLRKKIIYTFALIVLTGLFIIVAVIFIIIFIDIANILLWGNFRSSPDYNKFIISFIAAIGLLASLCLKVSSSVIIEKDDAYKEEKLVQKDTFYWMGEKLLYAVLFFSVSACINYFMSYDKSANIILFLPDKFNLLLYFIISSIGLLFLIGAVMDWIMVTIPKVSMAFKIFKMSKYRVIGVLIIFIGIIALIIINPYSYKYNKGSKAYADKVISIVFANWDSKNLIEQASPELRKVATPDKFRHLFNFYAQRLGKLKKYKEEKDPSNDFVLPTDKNIIVHYTVEALYQKAPAKIEIYMIMHDNKWQISSFDISSKVLPP